MVETFCFIVKKTRFNVEIWDIKIVLMIFQGIDIIGWLIVVWHYSILQVEKGCYPFFVFSNNTFSFCELRMSKSSCWEICSHSSKGKKHLQVFLQYHRYIEDLCTYFNFVIWMKNNFPEIRNTEKIIWTIQLSIIRSFQWYGEASYVFSSFNKR